MVVTVQMTDQEFLEFDQWRKDKRCYNVEVRKLESRFMALVKKITFALIRDEKKPKKIKILDQEHAMECLEWAEELLDAFEP